MKWIPILIAAGSLALASSAAALNATPAIISVDKLGGASFDTGDAIAVLDDGSAYVAGTAQSKAVRGHPSHGQSDVFLARYSAKGKLRWLRMIGTQDSEFAPTVAVAPDGAAIVAGIVSLGDPKREEKRKGFVVRVTPAGTVEWSVDIPAAYRVSAVATGETGEVYVAGAVQGKPANGFDLFVSKLTSHGKAAWQRQIEATSADAGTALLPTPEGILVAGFANDGTFMGHETGSGEGIGFVLPFDTDGTPGEPTIVQQGVFVIPQAMTSAADGAFALSGTVSYRDGSSRLMVAKLDANRIAQWLRTYAGPGLAEGRGIAAGSRGSLYVAGTARFGTDYQAALWHIGGSGRLLASRFDGDTAPDVFNALGVHGDTAWAAGYSDGTFGGAPPKGVGDALIVRYRVSG